MANELYGVYAHVSETLATTPVSVETNIVFYGTAPGGSVGVPVLLTSWRDAVEKLGVASNDGYTLTDACLAAFQLCNLSHIYCIRINEDSTVKDPDDGELEAACLRISELWMTYGVIANIICAPRVDGDNASLSWLTTAATKQNGQFDGVVIFDGKQKQGQISANGEAIISALTSENVKGSTSEIAICHWGYAKLLSGDIISGAAVRACRWAVADAENAGRIPSRCSGNLGVDIQSVVFVNGRVVSLQMTVVKDSSDYHYRFTITTEGYTSYTGTCSVTFRNGWGQVLTEEILFTNGVGKSNYYYGNEISGGDPEYRGGGVPGSVDIIIAKSDADQLSADGIGTFLNIGGGKYVTWGDHTAAFTNSTVDDERARFDNFPRMRMLITNRFQQKWRSVIDDRMDLKLRNDILTEEGNYLNYLVSIGGLIGSPRCEFRPVDNTQDTIKQGQFYFYDVVTYTPPAKYIDLGVAFSDEGYLVYLEG